MKELLSDLDVDNGTGTRKLVLRLEASSLKEQTVSAKNLAQRALIERDPVLQTTLNKSAYEILTGLPNQRKMLDSDIRDAFEGLGDNMSSIQKNTYSQIYDTQFAMPVDKYLNDLGRINITKDPLPEMAFGDPTRQTSTGALASDDVIRARLGLQNRASFQPTVVQPNGVVRPFPAPGASSQYNPGYNPTQYNNPNSPPLYNNGVNTSGAQQLNFRRGT